MKDYLSLAEETKKDLDKLGIRYRKVSEFTVNTRAKKRWGLCKKTAFNTFQIEISSRLLENDVADQTVKNVIAHELLHTVQGCYGHRGKWKQLADYINRSLPHYLIKTTDSPENIGVTIEQKPTEIRYTVVCTKCGIRIDRTRKSKLIMHPEWYRCAKCGGKLKLINRVSYSPRENH